MAIKTISMLRMGMVQLSDSPVPRIALAPPAQGQIVQVRTRRYVVDRVDPDPSGTRVGLLCLDDDAQGRALDVVWELELQKQILDEQVWSSIGKKGFDSPRFFAAYMRTLRWNCVSATDPKLFQAPFRAGIRIDAYQLEPLRKALLLPRVNLFIADDVGLGKTIEAGLIGIELLLRRRVREVVIVCPPSMLSQWQEEMENRFGLVFEILNRDYVERVRQERGFGVNPWTTYPRILVSNKLLIDEFYAGPLRAWLDNLRPGTLLIFDEAHHAAPASGAKYAIDSKITRAIRDIAPRFEHRLFLSATPHNGHSNSFSALLEILDPQRFTRGVKVLKRHRDAVMVRRLKEDIRQVQGGFPKREIVQVEISDLPEDAPELALARLLDQYRQARDERLKGATQRQRVEAGLLTCNLQQRLLSSVYAFSRTLKVHARTMERIWAKQEVPPSAKGACPTDLLEESAGADDERSELPEEELAALEEAQVEEVTRRTAGGNEAKEKALLEQMMIVADAAGMEPDGRVRHLIDWIRKNLLDGTRWREKRVIVFTEYEDTLRYLRGCLEDAIANTDNAAERIAVFHGPTPSAKRDAIKTHFNEHPSKDPLRILLCNDAAREGLNLQAHCFNLFHFDVPWNPSRLEQRNGRIDRKLQPSDTVYCHYFVYEQRLEDRVLRALVTKTDTIRSELGSLSQVIDVRLSKLLKGGIVRAEASKLEREIEEANLEGDKRATVEEELEAARSRQQVLTRQIDDLRTYIEDAKDWIGLDTDHLKEALSCSLEIMGAKALKTDGTQDGAVSFRFPNLQEHYGADPSWVTTLDTLRKPPKDGIRGALWRKESPIRPIVFEPPNEMTNSVVQLHLQHRVVQRLLGRFTSQGFVYHDLSRTCLAQADDALARVVLLGRLSLYGVNAARLHEELLAVSARWQAPELRKGPLSAYGRAAEDRTMNILESSLSDPPSGLSGQIKAQLERALPLDIEQLLPHLKARGAAIQEQAAEALTKRGKIESQEMVRVLQDQRIRVLQRLEESKSSQIEFEFDEQERKQLAADRKCWENWLRNVDGDIEREPQRIREFYEVRSSRIEPVGLVYLWPVSG
jgi:SNF2 family DNA or RNA helicase